MEFFGQVVFGIAAVMVAIVLFAVPGFVAGGAIGLLVRRFFGSTRRVVGYIIGAWLALCVAGTSAVIIQSEIATHHGALDALGELLVLLLGVATALGGSYALHRSMRPRRRTSSA